MVELAIVKLNICGHYHILLEFLLNVIKFLLSNSESVIVGRDVF